MTSVMPKKDNVIAFPQRQKPKVCALTAEEENKWNKTRVALVWHCPAFAHILFSMLDNANSKHIAYFTEEVPIAATDGSNLLLNPKTFFKYNLNERIFIVAHEIMHCIWNHIVLMHGFIRRGKVSFPDGTSLPYDPEYMNIATDLVINDCLIESKIGSYNKDWLHDPSIATAKDSAIDAYKKVFKKKPKGGGGRFDEHLPPGTSTGNDPQEAASGRNDVEWATQITAAANAARAQGKLPAGLDRLLGELLEPKVDWQDKIVGLFNRRVGSGSFDWQRPNRRFIVFDFYSPERSGFGANCVVVAGDTSGSIGYGKLPNGQPSTGDMFFSEMAGILESVRPKRLVIMWCDAKVHRVDEAEEAADLAVIRHKGAPGGGGTDFRPVFKEIEEMGLEPDALVFLTDGFGTFPSQAPDYLTIWGSITPEDMVKYPFGEVVFIPQQVG